MVIQLGVSTISMKILSRFEDISHALVEQVHGREHPFRHFAFLFNKNKIISIGWNKFKQHPASLKHGYRKDAGIHAELDSVLAAKLDDYSRIDMAVLRIGRRGNLTMSKPCVYCENLIDHLGIRRVWFTNETGEWQRL